jgi:hypothetical protein
VACSFSVLAVFANSSNSCIRQAHLMLVQQSYLMQNACWKIIIGKVVLAGLCKRGKHGKLFSTLLAPQLPTSRPWIKAHYLSLSNETDPCGIFFAIFLAECVCQQDEFLHIHYFHVLLNLINKYIQEC